MQRSIRFLLTASLFASGLANAGLPAFGQAPARPNVQQIEALEGTYALTNGKRLRVVQVENRLFADLNRNTRMELFMDGPQAVTSRDGRVRIHLPHSPAAEPSIVLHSGVSSGPLLSSR